MFNMIQKTKKISILLSSTLLLNPFTGLNALANDNIDETYSSYQNANQPATNASIDLQRATLAMELGNLYSLTIVGHVTSTTTQVLISGADDPWDFFASTDYFAEDGSFELTLTVNHTILNNPQVANAFRMKTSDATDFTIEEITVEHIGVDLDWTITPDTTPAPAPLVELDAIVVMREFLATNHATNQIIIPEQATTTTQILKAITTALNEVDGIDDELAISLIQDETTEFIDEQINNITVVLGDQVYAFANQTIHFATAPQADLFTLEAEAFQVSPDLITTMQDFLNNNTATNPITIPESATTYLQIHAAAMAVLNNVLGGAVPVSVILQLNTGFDFGVVSNITVRLGVAPDNHDFTDQTIHFTNTLPPEGGGEIPPEVANLVGDNSNNNSTTTSNNSGNTLPQTGVSHGNLALIGAFLLAPGFAVANLAKRKK